MNRNKVYLTLNKKMIMAYIIIIAYFKFFYMVALPGSYGHRANSIMTVLLSCVSFAYMVIKYLNEILRAPFYKYFLCFYLFFGMEIIYTKLMYRPEPLFNSFKEFSLYLALLSYFVFFVAVKTNSKKFINFIISCSTILAFLFLLQALFFDLFEMKFLQIYGFNYGKIHLDYRKGIRLITCDMVGFSPVLSIGRLFQMNVSQKDKMGCILNVILVSLYLYFVDQTRSMILVLGGVMFLVIFFCGKKNSLQKPALILIALTVGVIAYNDIFDFIKKIIDMVGQSTDYSFYHRLDAIGYYFSVLKTKPVFGIGLLNDSPTVSSFRSIVHGNDYFSYSYSDVGIIGVLGKFGILGIFFYLYPIIIFYKRSKLLSSGKGLRESMNFALFAGAFLCSLSLSYFDAERIIILTVFMAVSDSVVIQREGIKEKNDVSSG